LDFQLGEAQTFKNALLPKQKADKNLKCLLSLAMALNFLQIALQEGFI